MSAIEALFWASALMVVYPYFGYIAVLRLITIFSKRPSKKRKAGHEPEISLIISAYNEEKVIEDKILNSLGLDYPKEKLEIIVVSDGSDDRTVEIAKKYAKSGVVLRHYEGRVGKTACLNSAVPLARGELIVFSDANSRYDRFALRRLAGAFSDPSVGFATGRTMYAADESGWPEGPVGFYSRLENTTKALESSVGSCVGADGAIFAIRKELYSPLESADINDLVIPLKIIGRGFAGRLVEDSFCVERTAGGNKGEFNRQVRITARTLRAVFNNMGLLNPFKYGFFSFELLSHKVLRLTAPFFLAVLFISNAFLLPEGLFYRASMTAQAALYLFAFLEYIGAGRGLSKRLFSVSCAFATVNAAILLGWFKYLSGETFVTWSPTKR